MKEIILKGQRVTLRPICLTDAYRYVKWFKDKEVTRFTTLQKPVALLDERKYIRSVLRANNEIEFNWSIIVEGQHIGSTGIMLDKVNQTAMIGIIIGAKAQWGKGYAQECISLVAQYVFESLQYRRLQLRVNMENVRAIHVYKKLGFVLERVRHKVQWNAFARCYEDCGSMGIAKEQWMKCI